MAAEIVEGLVLQMIWISAEDFFLAGGEAFFFFETEHDRNILIAVKSIGDEEGNHYDVRSPSELCPNRL